MSVAFESMLIPPSIVEEFVPKIEESERSNSVVLLGSFKYYDQILATAREFESLGTRVIAPDISPITSETNGFQILDSDNQFLKRLQVKYPGFSEQYLPAFLEKRFMMCIKEAGFIYIVCPNGYAGETVAAEQSYARALGKPIYSSEPLDPTLDEQEGIIFPPIWRYFAESVKPYTVYSAARMAKSGIFDIEDYDWCEEDNKPFKWPREKNNRWEAGIFNSRDYGPRTPDQ